MTIVPPASAVIYDLEFTAWEGSMARQWQGAGEFKEVVQIGALKVTADYTVCDTLNILVRPRLNTVLSPYFENLTGLSGRMVEEHGVDFRQAYEEFVRFAGGLPIIAFGRDDLVLMENVRLYGLKNLPPLPPYIDLRQWLAENGVDPRGLHSCDVGPAAGIAFEGHKHDAVCDCRSLAAGVKAFIARGFTPPTLPRGLS